MKIYCQPTHYGFRVTNTDCAPTILKQLDDACATPSPSWRLRPGARSTGWASTNPYGPSSACTPTAGFWQRRANSPCGPGPRGLGRRSCAPACLRHREHQHRCHGVTVNTTPSACTPTTAVRHHRKRRRPVHFGRFRVFRGWISVRLTWGSVGVEGVWAAPPTGASLTRQGPFASLRDGLRPPLTREPLCTLWAGERAGQRPARGNAAAQTRQTMHVNSPPTDRFGTPMSTHRLPGRASF